MMVVFCLMFCNAAGSGARHSRQKAQERVRSQSDPLAPVLLRLVSANAKMSFAGCHEIASAAVRGGYKRASYTATKIAISAGRVGKRIHAQNTERALHNSQCKRIRLLFCVGKNDRLPLTPYFVTSEMKRLLFRKKPQAETVNERVPILEPWDQLRCMWMACTFTRAMFGSPDVKKAG